MRTPTSSKIPTSTTTSTTAAPNNPSGVASAKPSNNDTSSARNSSRNADDAMRSANEALSRCPTQLNDAIKNFSSNNSRDPIAGPSASPKEKSPGIFSTIWRIVGGLFRQGWRAVKNAFSIWRNLLMVYYNLTAASRKLRSIPT